VEVFFLLFGFEFALALDDQGAAFDADVEVFAADAGDLELECELLGVFVDIDRGDEVAHGEAFGGGLKVGLGTSEVVEDGVEAVLKDGYVVDATERNKTSHSHRFSPQGCIAKVTRCVFYRCNSSMGVAGNMMKSD
jgi:hypothetical protein